MLVAGGKRLSGVPALAGMSSRYLSIPRNIFSAGLRTQSPAAPFRQLPHVFLRCINHPVDRVCKRCIVGLSADSLPAQPLQFLPSRQGCAWLPCPIALRSRGAEGLSRVFDSGIVPDSIETPGCSPGAGRRRAGLEAAAGKFMHKGALCARKGGKIP